MPKRFDPTALRRIVVKVGSSSIINEEGLVRLGFLGKLATTIGRWRRDGVETVLVSSGAIAMGSLRIGRDEPPVRIQDKQALASIGQSQLMGLYQRLLSTLGVPVGQVLLSRDDLEDRRRYLNARETLQRLLELGAVPIINENDSVAVDEIQFGDNDQLSALVAGLVGADLLVLLTNVDGLYDSDPRENPDAKVIERLDRSLEEMLEITNGKPSAFGKGGMRSKLEAAQLCHNYGIHCVIARGRGSVLQAVLAGRPTGTYVPPSERGLSGRERWLANAALVAGELVLDDGAVEAMTMGHHSLLPSGIVRLTGDFARGAVIKLVDQRGKEIGRGVVRYGRPALEKIIGKRGDEIEKTLGFTYGDRVIHRDNIVLTG
ncbi:MAG: glutamate 5-kinase [Candidatus Lernaella stagnicola]|nr:glutamate 5-kinase [Candidatus Lernaella stagnicola]